MIIRRIASATLLLLSLTFGLDRAHGALADGFDQSGPLPCAPSSDYLESADGGPDPAFCSQWNPDFGFKGRQCCQQFRERSRKRWRSGRCAPRRAKGSYCDEMTEDQKKYAELAKNGALGDILNWLTHEAKRKRMQAYCGVDDGFLAWGRMIIPTDLNRIKIKSEYRCTDFGTDSMAGMLEWVGRQVAARYRESEYTGVRLLVGDVSAPRGGCMAGRGGRRGHRSHTSGEDADIGYLNAKANSASPDRFSKQFDAQTNWWLIKRFFQNPFACVKVIFLDRRHINSLRKVAGDENEWKTYARFIRHVPGHRNHMHVRIGEGPGLPGCLHSPDEPVDPSDDESDSVEASEAGPERWIAN